MNDKKMNIKVVNENNEVIVKFSISNFELDTTSSSIKFTENNDATSLQEGYVYSTEIKNFLYIIRYYSIHLDNITFDKNSLDCFYTFSAYEEEYVPELNQYFFEQWSEYDFPILFKHKFNINKKANYLGVKNFSSKDILIENSFISVYVDEDITDNEIKSIVKFLSKKNPLYKKLNSILDARTSSLEDLENAYSFVKAYEKKVQNVIDSTKDIFEERFEKDLCRDYGFDCGFLLVFTQNEEYNRNKRLLINSPIRINNEVILSTEELRISFPLLTQSTTLKVEMFEFLKPILEKEIKDSFYYRTILD